MMRRPTTTWWCGAALVLGATLVACEAPPEDGLRFRVLPQVPDDTPAALACEASARGEGLNGERGAVNIGVVRLQLRDTEGAPLADGIVQIQGGAETVRFDGVPPGRDYELSVAACLTPESPSLWIGADRGVSVAAGKATERSILLLPAQGFACAGAAPEAPVAFAAGFSPDGKVALLAGGLTSWTAAGPAQATDKVLRFDPLAGTFEDTGATLPSPMGMASAVVARPTPEAQPALVMLGGVSQILEGPASKHGDLLPFGPAPASNPGGAVWVEATGSGARVREQEWPQRRRFAAGVAAASDPQGDLVAVVGGISYDEGARAEATAELVRLGADGPSVTTVTLQAGRVGPAVVALGAGRFLVIGGNLGTGTPLAEIIDAATSTSAPVVATPAVALTPEQEALVRPSVFPTVVATEGGFLVLGGLPVFGAESMVPVARAAVAPVLYRLALDPADPTVATLDVPAAPDGPLATLSQRALPTVVPTAGGVQLMGGISAEVAAPFVPRRDGLLIPSTGPEPLSALPAQPYHAIGATVVGFWDDSSLVLGGVVELAVGQAQLAPTRTALLRRGERGLESCLVAAPAPDDAPDAGSPDADSGDAGAQDAGEQDAAAPDDPQDAGTPDAP